MENTNDAVALHIMIIDDNPDIHSDFIKVLASTTEDAGLKAMEEQLFGEDAISHPKGQKTEMALPKFIFNTACQGQEGVWKIKEDFKKNIHYALAFVDIRMPPGWDGIETIKHIWKIDPEVQVVICTAYSDYSWEETAHELGMGDNYLILKKPFDLVAVKQLTAALSRKWLLAKNAHRTTQMLKEAVEEKTASLQQSLSLLRSTIESSGDGILVVDLENNLIDCNQNFITMWHIPDAMKKSKNGQIIFEYMLRQMNKQHGGMQTEGAGKIEKIERLFAHPVVLQSGHIFECSQQPHRLNGKTIGKVWSFRDVTERIAMQKKLEYQASHDTLTGLPNRMLLMDRMHQCIVQSKRHHSSFAVLFFDLDRFKLINDSLSHEAGDELLCAVAKRWSMQLRKMDTIARLGGDEFVMILRDLDAHDAVLKVLEKILASLNKPFNIAKRLIAMTTSVGVSLYPKDGGTVNTLLKNADLAMYQAKERGGNQYQFYTKKLNNFAMSRLKLETELHQAVINHEFELYYQPQFDVDGKKLLSAEALIRWQHPTKGLLLPMDFIPTAEASGLIIPIGEWVIDGACRQIHLWHEKGLPWFKISVNVTMQQLRQPHFAETVKAILEKNQVEPQYLEMEITENVIITHVEVIRMINELKALGVNIVLDDFGTGNSSLNYLKKIHIDRLKIDKSFIRNIAISRSDEVIIEAIIAMARSFNFKILAEGVETKAQMQYLKDKNCDEIQGFYVGKPVSSSVFEGYLKDAAG